jgi:hypothetical protein
MGNVVKPALGLAALLLSACAIAPGIPDVPPPVFAEQPAQVNPFTACHREKPNEVAVLDETRERLQETVCGASLWFDGLFGERDLAAARTAHGRLEVSTAHSEFEGRETRVRFDARVKLPALEQRLSAFIGRDNQDDIARDRSEGLGLRSQADELDQVEDWFAGLGYRLKEDWGIRSEFRVGVRGLRQPKAFAQLRNIWNAYEDDDDRVQLRATPFVNNLDGAGFTLSVDFDHALSATRLLRWGSAGTVTEESAGVGWRSAVLLYQSLRELRAIAFEAFERGATGAPEPLVEYGVRVIYRQPLLKRRLFAELVPGYSWPRVDPALPREGSAGVTFGLELPFGRKP